MTHSPPVRTTAPTIFLDFDGVLHPTNVLWRHGEFPVLAEHLQPRHRLFEHAGLLTELLQPFPDVRLVLATAWVRLYGYEVAASHLPESLRSRLDGATFDPVRDNMAFSSVGRGYQVVADAKRRKLKNWVALDDDARDWPRGYARRLIATDPVFGLNTPELVSALERWLKASSQ